MARAVVVEIIFPLFIYLMGMYNFHSVLKINAGFF